MYKEKNTAIFLFIDKSLLYMYVLINWMLN